MDYFRGRWWADFVVPAGTELAVSINPDDEESPSELLRPIDLVIDGYPVRVTPNVDERSDEEEGNGTRETRHRFIAELEASVTILSDAPDLHSADKDFHYLRPRRAAAEALRRVLAHLRSVMSNPSVDTRLSGFHLVEYRDELATEIDTPSEWEVDDTLGSEDVLANKITEGLWAKIARAVKTGEDVPLGRTWLLDSKVFLSAGNYNMALTSAAVACEIFAYDLIGRGLTASGRVTRTGAQKFTAEVSNRQLLPTMLAFLEIADATLSSATRQVFADRNAIIHGQRHRQVSLVRAQAAIDAAEALQSRICVR